MLSLSFDLILFYNLVRVPSARCSGTFMERKFLGTAGERERGRKREAEFAFVYNICMCTWSSVRTCVWCRSMRVNVFIKL